MSDRVTFTFSQVDAVLASMNFIAEHKRAAFAARVKQLFRHDFLEETAMGRGRAGTYTVLNLLQLAIAVEFLQSGMSPPLVANAIKKNKTRLLQALVREGSDLVRYGREEDMVGYADNDLFMALTPEALRELVAEGDRPEPGYFELYPSRLLDRRSIRADGYKEASWRRLIINVSDVIRELQDLACMRFRFVDATAFADDIMLDVEDLNQVVLEVHETRIGVLSEQQIAELSGIPDKEPAFGTGALPPGCVTMSEWEEMARVTQVKNKGSINKLIKAVKALSLDGMISSAKALESTGMFRLNGSELMITRLGKATLRVAGFNELYWPYEEDAYVGS